MTPATEADEVFAESELLRLHVDQQGAVWYGDDDQLAVNTCLDAQAFLQTMSRESGLYEARRIRLLGSPANAPLVVHLQQYRRAHPEMPRRQKIHLCSPGAIPSAALMLQPEAVLQHLWQPGYSNRLHGAWHDMDTHDYCTYAMIAEGCGLLDAPDVAKRLAVYHPAWPAVSFLTPVNLESACKFLCEIVDPRWYAHPHRPSRLTKLYSYLGLTPENMHAFWANNGPVGRHFDRAMLSVRVWYSPGTDMRGPGGFLMRMFTGYRDKIRGLLDATQRLVRLVYSIWMMAVSPPHPEMTFSPRTFFRGEEAEAFAAHMDACRPVGN